MGRRLGILLLICLLLTGCTPLLDREYRSVELHSSKFWESGNEEILRAESYQDVVNDLMLLISEQQTQATLRLYTDQNKTEVERLLEKAASEVQKETPMGSYAVGYIITESVRAYDYYEVTVRIGYRRSNEEMKSIISVTSVNALEDLLDAAMNSGRRELAVRIGYWDAEAEAVLNIATDTVEMEWNLTGKQQWTVQYYPGMENVGLIEFVLEPVRPVPVKPAEPEEPEQSQEPEQPLESEQTGEVAVDGGEIPGGEPADGENGGGQAPEGGEPPAGEGAETATEPPAENSPSATPETF